MSDYIVYPKGLEFFDWANFIRQSIQSLEFPVPFKDMDWRWWAYQVFFLNQEKLPFVPYPHPLAFPGKESWSKWADFFVFNAITK